MDFVNLAKRFPQYKFIWFGYSPLAAATKPVKKAVHTKLDNLTFAGYVEGLSEFKKQRELLLDKDSLYRVLSTKRNQILLEVI